jgi:hypothetical protein
MHNLRRRHFGNTDTDLKACKDPLNRFAELHYILRKCGLRTRSVDRLLEALTH